MTLKTSLLYYSTFLEVGSLDVLSGLYVLSGSSRGESVFLSFLASRGCPCSFAHGSLPSSKPVMVGQVLLMLWLITLDLHFFGGGRGKEPLHKQFGMVVNSPIIPCMSEINFSTFFGLLTYN